MPNPLRLHAFHKVKNGNVVVEDIRHEDRPTSQHVNLRSIINQQGRILSMVAKLEQKQINKKTQRYALKEGKKE